MHDEQFPVMGRGQLLDHQRPQVGAEINGAGHGVDHGNSRIAVGDRAGMPSIAELGMVRNTAAGSDVQHRLSSTRQVPQVGALVHEPASATFVDQYGQIDEGESETADQHGLAGAEMLEVQVGGMTWRCVGHAVRRRRFL